MNATNTPSVQAYDKMRTYYKKNTALFGLITWYTEVKTEFLGTEVVLRVPKGTNVTVLEDEL